MNTSNDYHHYHLRLIASLLAVARQAPPFNQEHLSELDQDFIERLEAICRADCNSIDITHEGQQLISRIVSQYPHITPQVPRDLFWYFGGDCLHFMPDDEIAQFQQLEELRGEFEGSSQPVSYESLRAKVFGMH